MKGRARQWDPFDDYVLRTLHGNGRSSKWIATFMCCAVCTVHRRAQSLGLAFEGRHHWTAAEDALLRKRYPDERTADIARDMGFRTLQVSQRATVLGLHKSAAYLASPAACRLRHGDEVGRAYRFPKGHVPANKGLRRPGWAPGRMRETQFKKGRPASEARNYVPIGTEKFDGKRGVIVRKLTDDPSIFPANRWKPVHVIVWEAAHGPVPEGHIVRFKSGMKTLVTSEITPDRLEMVTLAENMRLNTVHRYPKEVVGLIRMKGVLNRKINRITRQQHEKQDARCA